MNARQYKNGKLVGQTSDKPKPQLPATAQAPKRQRGHTMPKSPSIQPSQLGRYRVAHVLAVLGVSHSTFYAGLKPACGGTASRYPPPDGYDGRLPYWKTSTIKALLDA